MKVVDLFSGAGGLSLGAARAGFTVTSSVEIDPQALETHQRNFPGTKHINADIARLSGEDLLTCSRVRRGQLDGLVGGPPCQGFSYIGKRDKGDTRNDLYVHFFRLVTETLPTFFLAENVPGIMDSQYDDLRTTAFNLVSPHYTLLPPIEIKASNYGASTIRTRIFFIGYRTGERATLDASDFLPSPDVERIPVAAALQGLPQHINPAWQDEESGWQPREHLPDTTFFQNVSGNIPEGVGNTVDVDRFLSKNEVSGCLGTLHSERVIARMSGLAHGQMDKISKSVKLDPDGFCPTLRAGTSKEKGSHQAVRPIHPFQNRVITPREASRLQGFPDWFVFHRTKWHSFRQIGNSVSPLVAQHVLNVVRQRIFN